MKKLLLTMTLLMLAISTPVVSKTFEVPLGAPYLEVLGVVDGSIITDVSQKLMKIINNPKNKSKDIYMLINSPGGAVLPGTSALDAMRIAKSRGYNFKCISGVLAASMAFSILVECNERYALQDTKLLFHPMSTSIRKARVQELMISTNAILKLEKRIMAKIQKELKMSSKEFHRHYFAETMWAGLELSHAAGDSFLTIVDNVVNVPGLFKLQKSRRGFRQGLNISAPGIMKARELLKRLGI